MLNFGEGERGSRIVDRQGSIIPISIPSGYRGAYALVMAITASRGGARSFLLG